MTLRLLALILVSLLAAVSAQPSWTDQDGATVTLSSLRESHSSGLVMFVTWCSYCHSCRAVEKDLEQMARDYDGRVSIVALAGHPADNPKTVHAFQNAQKLHFPVLFDPVGGLVDSLNIRRTTTALVYDKTGVLRYFGPLKIDQKNLGKEAVDALLAGHPVPEPRLPQQGCPIPRP